VGIERSRSRFVAEWILRFFVPNHYKENQETKEREEEIP